MRRPAAMGGLEWVLLLLLSVLWGGSFFFSKIAVRELPPIVVVLVRVALAAAALALYLRVTARAIPWTQQAWTAFFGMGLLNNLLPFSLLFWAQTQLPSGLTAILNATTPIFSILVAHAVTADEKATPGKIAGVLLGIVGVAVLFGGPATLDATHATAAMVACLAASLSYGCASVFGRRFRRMAIAPAVVAFGQTTASSIMMLPIVLLLATPWRLPIPSAATCAALVGLALFSTAVAYIIFFQILAVAGAVNISLVTLLVPISAILLGSLILGERLAANHIAGMIIIALALVAIDGRVFGLVRSTPRLRSKP